MSLSMSSLGSSNGSPPKMTDDSSPSVVRAVIYARVSSLAQRDRHTIASQLATLPQFVSLRGWKLVKPPETYVDDGRTAKEGFLAKRTAFTRLMQDAASRLFDVVVVVDLDRLTRSEDLRERGEVLGAFQRAGVQLAVSSTGQVLDLRSSVGDLMSSLGTFFAAEANRKHRERITRGKDEAIRKGRKPAGPTPFGYLYSRETGEWSIDPELGPVVVEIFTRVSRGETCDSIARDLQAREIPRARQSKSGRRAAGVWILERVHQIARARTYLGSWVADKTRQLSIPVPRIVSDALYARADEALRRAGRRGRLRNPHKYLLQGISVCAVCRGPIGCASTGSWVAKGAKRRNFYYVCSNRRRPRRPEGSCTLPMMRSEIIDERFWKTIVDRVISDAHIEEALADHRRDEEPAEDPRASLLRLENRRKQLGRAEEVLLERFGRGLITDTALDKELLRLKTERGSIERAVVVVQNKAKRSENATRTAEALRMAVSKLRERLRMATAEDRRDIVRAIVASGENGLKISPDRIEANILLSAPGPSAVAQPYAAGSVSGPAGLSPL
jgi:DNA invertase Pin-like site-specific DNA recombinase